MATFASITTAILTAVIALFTFLVWKVYRRIGWLTGAMESHSDLALLLQARSANPPVEVVWWDSTIEPLPIPEHGEPRRLDRIFVKLPPPLRAQQPTWKEKLRGAFAGH